jgi:glutathione synthase/RimK-type ligase-like ATP-grasp enzyme
VAKPAFGAGGRDVIFGDETSCIPSDAREPWVVQRRLPPHFVRALIVDGQVICSYERENDPGLPNNIEAGGRRVFRRLTASERDLALAAAEAVGTVISGVDLAVDDLAVLEVNGSPGLPPEFVRKTAEVAAAFLLRA